MKPNVVIVRFDEIGIKAEHTRNEFIKRIVNQLKILIPKSKVQYSPYRILIFSKNPKKTARIAARVFGISSLSPAICLERNIEKIKKAAYSFYENGKTFRISCQRSDKDYELNSQEVSKTVGEYIYERGGKVDLKNYETNIGIDFFSKKAFVFSEKFRGFGGLPAGSEGKILSIINNERDYLACLMMANRGCLPIVYGKKKYYTKLAKNFPYLKIQRIEKITKKDYLAVSSGNALEEMIQEFECPVFYPLAFVSEDFIKEKFKSVN